MPVAIPDALSLGTSGIGFFAPGPDLAAAATLNFQHSSGAGPRGFSYRITNAGESPVNVTAVTLVQGREVQTVVVHGGVTFVHGASLILPGGANITAEPGDVAYFVGEASSVVRCTGYERADGTSLVGGGGGSSLTDAGTLALSGSTSTETALGANTSGRITLATGGSGQTHTVPLPAGATNDIIERRLEIASGALRTVTFKDAGDNTIDTYTATGAAGAGFVAFVKTASAWEVRGINAVII